MKRSNLIIVVALLLLGGLSAYLYYVNQQEKPVVGEKDFAVENPDEIYKIFLAHKNGTTAKLERKGDYWLLNDTYKADSFKVADLLNTMSNLVVKYELSESKWNMVLTDLATESIKVEVYGKGESEPFKVYFVGKGATDGSATYMLMQIDGESAETPYAVGINGRVADIRYNYEVVEEKWRDLGVFDFTANQISMVELEYTDVPNSSFRIYNEGGRYRIDPYLGDEMIKDRSLNELELNNYLQRFEFLNAETVDNKHPARDSIIEKGPVLKMKVVDTEGNEHRLQVFPKPTDRRTKQQFFPDGTPVPFDPDRYYAIYNNGRDFGEIQQFVFGKVFRRLHQFYAPDPI